MRRLIGVTALAAVLALSIAAVASAAMPGGGMMGGGISGGGTSASVPMMGTGSGAGPGATTGGPTHFTDVPAGSWFATYADQMVAHGYMTGYVGGGFGPNDPVTRGQFAVIMARMMGLGPSAATTFSDLNGYPGAGVVEAMAVKGIVHGRADGTFGPYDMVTRAQMAAMMARALDATGHPASPAEMQQAMTQAMQQMHDLAGNWAAGPMALMVHMGVMQGDGHGMLLPGATTTRAQAAAMMWRWHEAAQPHQ